MAANVASSSRRVIRNPSPMDVYSDDTPILPDVEPEVLVPETVTSGNLKPATAGVNGSIDNARAAVLTEWRAKRQKATVSDEEDNDSEENSLRGNLDSDDESVGHVLPEDDEDSVDDSQSVDDRIEAEWEMEWAEMG
jgi:hypothetical protein